MKKLLLSLLLIAVIYGYQQLQVVEVSGEGDTVSFYGQFETNDRGGVIHWTHKDPQSWHVDGWLEHAGRRYQ